MIDPATECTCPLEHGITKLGHCRTCPWYGTTDDPSAHACVVKSQCEHDFGWATYADDNCSTGVCACGVREIDYCSMVGP